jgi:hypothetical protein
MGTLGEVSAARADRCVTIGYAIRINHERNAKKSDVRPSSNRELVLASLRHGAAGEEG